MLLTSSSWTAAAAFDHIMTHEVILRPARENNPRGSAEWTITTSGAATRSRGRIFAARSGAPADAPWFRSITAFPLPSTARPLLKGKRGHARRGSACIREGADAGCIREELARRI